MRTKWYLLGCGTSLALLVIFIIILVNSLVSMSKRATPSFKVVDNSVLHLDLTGPMTEYSTIADMNFKFIPQSLHDVIQKINFAKTDPKIKAIVLEPKSFQIGYAALNELYYALEDFKTSGKKVYGYITFAMQSDILLLSVADEVYMNPSASAGFLLHGMGGSMGFYKDMLDKMGIKMHIIRAGAFKSAGEPFSRTNMSPEFRANVTALYNDLYAQLLKDFSEKYEAPEETWRHIFERRDDFFINMQEGKNIKVVDELIFFDTFLKRIGVTDRQLVSHTKYRPQTNDLSAQFGRGQKIAVVYMLGNITSTKAQWGENNITSSEYVKIFDKLLEDDNIRGVVLRINSGGGSALESEIIYHKIAELREKKPVIVSMGGAAASGGYYIATNANYIFADPYTVTGSIGVFGMVPDLSGTAQKVGINTELVGHGKYLSAFDPFTPMSKDYERALQKGINETYDEFKNRVASGRDLSLNTVEQIAQGQIWSAPKALQLGLIDEIGGLNDAIAKAVEISYASSHSVVYYPERKSFWEAFMEDQFDFFSVKSLIMGQLPDFVSKEADKAVSFIEEIIRDPIQMRSEILDIRH